ncbi:MAG: hypothetical protein ABH986_00395 [archaeon]
MKGFVISVDAVIALVIAFAMLFSIAVHFNESRLNSLNEAKLALVSEDVLTVLEKNSKLQQAVLQGKNNEIAKYLNKTSQNLCFEINLIDFDNNSSALSTATKKGCEKGISVISVKRSFFVIEQEKFYWAEIKAWHKVNA